MRPSKKCKHLNVDHGPARVLDAAGGVIDVCAKRCLDCTARLSLGRSNDKPVKVEMRAAAIAQDANARGGLISGWCDITRAELAGWMDSGRGRAPVLSSGLAGYLGQLALGDRHDHDDLVCSDLVAFLDEELDPEADAFFRKHLDVCETCRRELPEQVQLSARLQILPGDLPPDPVVTELPPDNGLLADHAAFDDEPTHVGSDPALLIESDAPDALVIEDDAPEAGEDAS